MYSLFTKSSPRMLAAAQPARRRELPFHPSLPAPALSPSPALPHRPASPPPSSTTLGSVLARPASSSPPLARACDLASLLQPLQPDHAANSPVAVGRRSPPLQSLSRRPPAARLPRRLPSWVTLQSVASSPLAVPVPVTQSVRECSAGECSPLLRGYGTASVLILPPGVS